MKASHEWYPPLISPNFVFLNQHGLEVSECYMHRE